MSNANRDSTSVNIGEIVNRIDVLERSAKEASTDQAKIENYREWIKVGITVPSAVAIAVGLFVQLYNFLDYKNMALELSLSQEIISLNKQLNTQGNPGMVRNAIFLLSTLGPDAAPLLIYQIDNAGTESSIVDAIGFGLKQIIEKNRKGDYIDRERRITELLNIRMQDITNLQLKEDTPSKKSLTDHIEVLTTVYSLISCPDNHRSSINQFLVEAKQQAQIDKKELSYLPKLLEIFDRGIEATKC